MKVKCPNALKCKNEICFHKGIHTRISDCDSNGCSFYSGSFKCKEIKEVKMLKNILIVEDDLEKQKLFIDFLGDEFSLNFCDNGVSAIAALDMKYQYIFLDYNLAKIGNPPYLDGWDVAYFLVDSINNESEVIVHTGDEEEGEKIAKYLQAHKVNATYCGFGSKEFNNRMAEINGMIENTEKLNEDAADIKNEQDKSRGEED
jgi:CheY-like chemotaxis protein